MTGDCRPGCGCGGDSLYSDRECPACGGRLRITGSLQQIRMNLTCPGCGYMSPQLSMEELRELI